MIYMILILIFIIRIDPPAPPPPAPLQKFTESLKQKLQNNSSCLSLTLNYPTHTKAETCSCYVAIVALIVLLPGTFCPLNITFVAVFRRFRRRNHPQIFARLTI